MSISPSPSARAGHRMSCCFAVLLLAMGACAAPETQQSDRESEAIDRSLRAVAMSAEQRGDRTTALTYYRQLHRNDPANMANLLGYARALRATGSAKEAIGILEGTLSEGPENGAVLAELGRAQLAIDNIDDAVRSLTDAITAGNGEWRTFLALGVGQDRRGEHTAARKAYEAALLLAPNNLAVLNNLALSHALDGSIDTGIQILDRAAGAPGATIQIRQNLALLYGVSGDIESARTVAAIDLDEKTIEQNLAYYEALRSGGRSLKEALTPSQPETQDESRTDLLAPAGALRVELGGSPTVEAAIDRWESLRTNHQNVLGDLNVEIVKRKLTNGGSQFLTWAGPIADKSRGNEICAELRSKNVRCAIVSP